MMIKGSLQDTMLVWSLLRKTDRDAEVRKKEHQRAQERRITINV